MDFPVSAITRDLQPQKHWLKPLFFSYFCEILNFLKYLNSFTSNFFICKKQQYIESLLLSLTVIFKTK